MGKSTTPSFVVSLRLLPTKENEQELEYRFHAGAHLYNLCVKESRKRVHKLLKDTEYKTRRKAYSGTKEEQEVLFKIRARYGLAGNYSLEPYPWSLILKKDERSLQNIWIQVHVPRFRILYGMQYQIFCSKMESRFILKGLETFVRWKVKPINKASCLKGITLNGTACTFLFKYARKMRTSSSVFKITESSTAVFTESGTSTNGVITWNWLWKEFPL